MPYYLAPGAILLTKREVASLNVTGSLATVTMAYEQSHCVIPSDTEDENSVVVDAKPNNEERNIPTVEDVGRIFRRLMEETLTSKNNIQPTLRCGGGDATTAAAGENGASSPTPTYPGGEQPRQT